MWSLDLITPFVEGHPHIDSFVYVLHTLIPFCGRGMLPPSTSSSLPPPLSLLLLPLLPFSLLRLGAMDEGGGRMRALPVSPHLSSLLPPWAVGGMGEEGGWQCNAIQCNAMQCHAIAMQCNAM